MTFYNSISFYSINRGLTQCTQPVEVVSYKIGVCKVSPHGKECKTEFERLSFNSTTSTSVVLCRPFTGRMHQIRVHLQYLGNLLKFLFHICTHIWFRMVGKYKIILGVFSIIIIPLFHFHFTIKNKKYIFKIICLK